MSNFLLTVQGLIKEVARSLGLEIRYAFQNPAITSVDIYRPWISPDNVRCIFDVGANIGQSARKFVEAFPRSTVRSFEPFPAAYEKLAQVSVASSGRIKAYQVACGESEGSMSVVIDHHSASQLNQIRLCSDVTLLTPTERIMTIPVTTIDAICDREHIDMIDILKSDTEGFDAKVLSGAARVLTERRVRCIISEVGFLEDAQHTEFSQVFLLLHKFGYRIAGLYEISYFKNSRCDFGNALFIWQNAYS
jgi:FkbM family methyltransferase